MCHDHFAIDMASELSYCREAIGDQERRLFSSLLILCSLASFAAWGGCRKATDNIAMYSLNKVLENYSLKQSLLMPAQEA
jgi:hypothetical protein